MLSKKNVKFVNKIFYRPLKKHKIILKRSDNGKTPKNGLIFNILSIINFEPATENQIKRILPTATTALKAIEKNGLVQNRNGRLILTEQGVKKLNTLTIKLIGNKNE
jgi:hypothetical protein